MLCHFPLLRVLLPCCCVPLMRHPCVHPQLPRHHPNPPSSLQCGAPQRATTRALAQFEAWAERVQRVGEPASTGRARREAAAEVQRQGGEGVGRRNASLPRSQSQPPSAPLSLDQTSAPSSQLPKLFCLTAPSTSFPEFPRPLLLPTAPSKTQPVVGPASIPPSLPPSPPPSPPAGERSPAPATLGSMGPMWIMAGVREEGLMEGGREKCDSAKKS